MSDYEAPSDAIKIGCSDLPPGMKRSAFFDKLSLLELSAFQTGDPSRKAVRTWREKSPDSARYSLLGPSALCGDRAFPVDAAGQEALERFVDACQILGAEAAVFKTPAGFTPSAANRERMSSFFNDLATADRFGTTQRVWQPEGLWELATISELSEKLGLLVAIDPLAHDPLDENVAFVADHLSRGRAYLRITGMGHHRHRFEGYQLEGLAEMVLELEESWVLFGHPGKYPDALAFERVCAEL